MDNRFEAINLFSEEFTKMKDRDTVKIFGRNYELCGFLEKLDEYLIIFNKHRMFEGFCFTNKFGNIEKHNANGWFDEYFASDKSMIKYGKSGEYKGYYVAENNCINEFDDRGSYKGYFRKEKNGSVNKYDSMGHFELALEKEAS